jgi:hypothetical protein
VAAAQVEGPCSLWPLRMGCMLIDYASASLGSQPRYFQSHIMTMLLMHLEDG